MVDHFLLPYVVQAKQVHAREWLDLSIIADEAELASFLHWMKRELDAVQGLGLRTGGLRRLIGISSCDYVAAPFPKIQGRAESGDSGLVGRGIDTTQAGLPEKYQRTPWDAELQPFYFGICETADPTTAIGILHAVGKSGIKSALHSYLGGRLIHLNKEWRLHMTPLIPKANIFDMLSSDEILRVEYRKKVRAMDLSDLPFQPNSHKQVTVKLELKVHGDGLPLTARSRRTRLEQLAAQHAVFGQDFDEIRADVMIADRRRTIRLDHPGNLQPRYELGEFINPDALEERDLDEEIERIFETVQTEAQELMEHHRADFGAD